MLIYGYNALATVGSGYLVLRLKASGVVKLLPLQYVATWLPLCALAFVAPTPSLLQLTNVIMQ